MFVRLSFFLLLILPTLCLAEEIPIVGLDKNHREISASVSQAQYAEAFSHTITTVNDSTLSALESREQNSTVASPWMLRDVTIGIGLTFTAGLGPIYNVSAAPRVRMCFSNSTHPKFPD